MEYLTEYVSPWRVVGFAIVCLISLAFYRVTLHPLARFPGPRLAAITRYYETYYDVIKGGQYTFKIAELHKKYGPIIRISPHELHISDPAFFPELYRQDGGRWDKYAFAYDAFPVRDATVATADHHVHKMRRAPLGPFFSKAKVTARQNVIHGNVDKLCHRLLAFVKSGEQVNLGAAISALTQDVANQFITGKNSGALDEDDFSIGMMLVTQDGGRVWTITKHLPWFGPLLMGVLPMEWMVKLTRDPNMRAFFKYLLEAERHTKHLMDLAAEGNSGTEYGRTIVHEILESEDLPVEEKTHKRIVGDVVTVSSAGHESSATAMRLVLFHIFDRPEILKRLRVELSSAATDPSGQLEIKTLEQLPFLTALLLEGLRLSPGIASRMARIAPDRDLVYDKWRIPAGTPVGMTALLLHLDEEVYGPDPWEFEPERWMDPEFRKNVEGRSFAPFSRGTRNCMGMHLAWAEMYLVVATLVQRFDFRFVGQGATAKDLLCGRDQFSIVTPGRGTLNAFVSRRKE